MRVIKDLHIVDDDWQRIRDDQELPEGDVIISFRRWKQAHQTFEGRHGKLAICIDGDDDLIEVAESLAQFDLIALDFPVFTDGRSYSHAKLLRDRYHYQGELRAVGDVLRDQLFYMARCGINAFQLREDKDIQDAMNAFSEYTVKYQPSTDQARPVHR